MVSMAGMLGSGSEKRAYRNQRLEEYLEKYFETAFEAIGKGVFKFARKFNTKICKNLVIVQELSKLLLFEAES